MPPNNFRYVVAPPLTPVPTVVEPGTVLKGSNNQAFLVDFGGECRPMPDSYQYAADGKMAAAALTGHKVSCPERPWLRTHPKLYCSVLEPRNRSVTVEPSADTVTSSPNRILSQSGDAPG